MADARVNARARRDVSEQVGLSCAYSRFLSKHSRSSYAVSDVVGIKIPKVDRNGVDDRILPCKVREHIEENDTYRVQSVHGIISNTFSAAALVDLTRATWPELSDLELTMAETRTVSLRAAASANSTINPDHGVVCNCKGSAQIESVRVWRRESLAAAHGILVIANAETNTAKNLTYQQSETLQKCD